MVAHKFFFYDLGSRRVFGYKEMFLKRGQKIKMETVSLHDNLFTYNFWYCLTKNERYLIDFHHASGFLCLKTLLL